MLYYVYVDNSNVFIEGQRVSAVAKGMAPNIYEAMNQRVLDTGWRIDYGSLYDFVCGGDISQVGSARLWGSIPPGDSFWEMVERKGFEVFKFERSPAGKEKKVDTSIAYQLGKDAHTIIDPTHSEITLVAGDKDYVPAVEDLVSDGFRVTVFFWGQAAQELLDVASDYTCLDPYLDLLTKRP